MNWKSSYDTWQTKMKVHWIERMWVIPEKKIILNLSLGFLQQTLMYWIFLRNLQSNWRPALRRKENKSVLESCMYAGILKNKENMNQRELPVLRFNPYNKHGGATSRSRGPAGEPDEGLSLQALFSTVKVRLIQQFNDVGHYQMVNFLLSILHWRKIDFHFLRFLSVHYC